MTVRRKPLGYDPTDPPEGVRLNFADVAARLRVTVTAMCEATGLGRATIGRLMNNTWPVRSHRNVIQEELRSLLLHHGAAEEELDTLFHARIASQARKAFDKVAQPEPPNLEGMPKRAAVNPKPEEENEHMLPAKQTLSRGARQAFQLFRNPFDSELFAEDEIFVNADFAYVREACLQAAMNATFVAVAGQSGAGKTTLVEHVEECIERDRRSIVMIRPSVLGMEPNTPVRAADILSAIVTALDARATHKQTMQQRTTQALNLLTASAEAGNRHLLLIEEAHSMSDETLRHLKRLHEARKVGRRPVLGILLIGQTELKRRLRPGYAPLREVTQRCEVVELLPLDNDLKAYLQHRAKQAGADLAKIIDDGGIEELRARLREDMGNGAGKRGMASQLYPLAVNNLLTAAMNMAAELGAPVVTRDVVRAV